MRIISEGLIRRFWRAHPDAEPTLRRWITLVRAPTWPNFAAVRQTFPDADRVDHLTVFNIAGNKYRLIAAIHYNRGIIFVREVLTHRDYDKGNWKP